MAAAILFVALLLYIRLTMPNVALVNMLVDPGSAITGTFLNTLKMRLFKSNTTITSATVLSDLTEADFTGYAAQNLSGFPAASVVGSSGSSTGDAKTFTVGSSPSTTNSIYGYYITDSGNTKLYGAQRDPGAPISMTLAGQTYTITPTFSAVSQ